MESKELRKLPRWDCLNIVCISNYDLKRELTVGKIYLASYVPDNETFLITTDYGQSMFMPIDRFELAQDQA